MEFSLATNKFRRNLLRLFLLGLAFSCYGTRCEGLENGLARTPPMGWNSWNKFGCNVNEQLIRDIADAMVSSGMRDAGYIYVNIDDCWHGSRDADGYIQPNPVTFPSGMAALADYVHSLGLKLGIYSDAGTYTCAGYPGSKGYEQKDADQYAAWGVDYLKYDWCYTAGQDKQQSYTLMMDCLLNTGRPIVYSICCWGFPGSWVVDVGNLWRTTGDISDSWYSMVSIIDINANLYMYAGPGHWNDPDMLEVGNGGMTDTEYRAHFSMWCIMAAPLIAGNDLRNMSQSTLEILTAPEVIAVDQDPLGKQGRRVRDYGDQEVWGKELINGNFAVALFNRGSQPANITALFGDLGGEFSNGAVIRDLWAREDLGTFTGSFTAEVPGHGVVLIKAEPVLPAGRVRFTEFDYSVGEDAGGATISVERSGGSTGAISVDYQVSAGSAQPDSDFLPASGTLSWDNGDCNDKTFVVTIIDNNDFQGNRTVSLLLENPIGGCGLGSPSSATLTIIEDDRPAAPSNLSVTEVTHNSVSLAWEPSGEKVTGYIVYRDGKQVAALPETQFINFGLSPLAMYSYVVSAYYEDAGLESAYSNAVEATTPEYVPGLWTCATVGNCMAGGQCREDTEAVYTIVGSGADIWNDQDAFQYFYKVVHTNGEIAARVRSIDNTNPWAKAAVMIRDSLTADSAHAMVIITPEMGTHLQYRAAAGGQSYSLTGSGAGAPHWIRLRRTGNTFTGYESADGVVWSSVGQCYADLIDPVYAGLAVTSGDNSVLCEATFDSGYVSFGSPDTEEPTSPNNLTVTDVTADSVLLTWEPSKDDIGVAGYRVFRNENPLGTTTATNYTDTGLSSCTEYSYVVNAYDYARNESEPSDACSVTTTGAHQRPDLNYDGITDFADFAEVVPHWLEMGGCGCPQGDFDYDGLVNLRDVSKFAQMWLIDSWETVAYWSFDEGAGTEVHDEIGGYDGIFRGGTPRWVSSWSGFALDLDGVDDYVEIPRFELNDNTVTFLAWIRGWKTGNWAGIVFYREMPANLIACGMHFGANDTLHYTWNNNSQATWGWSGGPVIPYNEWAMVALVIEPDKATAYVGSETSGLEYGTNNISHISQTLPALTIGWDIYAPERRFRGAVDEVRIFDRALGWEEISRLYGGGLN